MDMERLNRVLRRVRGEDPPVEPFTDRETLALLIRGEERSRDNYARLRCRCSGGARVLLTRLWNEENRHCRDLQAEYLARFGNTLCCEENVPPERDEGMLSALGRTREAEQAAAEEYLRCGRETADHRLRLLYEKHAREEEQHALQLTQLLRRGLG